MVFSDWPLLPAHLPSDGNSFTHSGAMTSRNVIDKEQHERLARRVLASINLTPDAIKEFNGMANPIVNGRRSRTDNYRLATSFTHNDPT